MSLPAGGRSVAQLLADLADAGPVCTPEDDVLFFEPDYETPRERAYRVRAAKALCRSCPALESCRAYALATHTTHGVWAALTASELRELRTGNQPREVA
ncbi:WhiB family transcriptional regulator [Nonomuraea sp. NPDC050328]|uniref:WhiB family transcriptional regulator n=1 Tax=Nonomuraea sp. NPDC050328 TaxID=3364361 RepID=UPI0037A19004